MILSDLPSIKYILDSSKMHMFALQNTSHKKLLFHLCDLSWINYFLQIILMENAIYSTTKKWEKN